MAVDNIVHVNEYGLPLNAIEWLVTHHQCKVQERSQMIRDLSLRQGSFVVDAGCGPGLWTPLLAEHIGTSGRILGIDISAQALLTARSRSVGSWYWQQVQYRCASLDTLPLDNGSVDVIFSANVSQYLLNPVEIFARMGPYLKRNGWLVVKDIDFGTMRFHNIDLGLQQRVFQARKRWEQERVGHGYAFEDSWVGSKLAGYLCEAGYKDVQEKMYRIVRRYVLPDDFRLYLRGIAEWFVCEGAPYVAPDDVLWWTNCFFSVADTVLEQEEFLYEETEFVVSGVWDAPARAFF